MLRKRKQILDKDMPPEIAEQMLMNIFDACRQEHNTVPLEILSAYSNYRRERFQIQQTILIIVMVLFLLLPVLFIPAQVMLTSEDGQTIAVDVSTQIPVRRVSAVMNGRNVAVYERASHHYVVQPTGNGELTVSATLINNQTTTAVCMVENIDNEAPKVIASDTTDEYIYLWLVDEGSGISYQGIYTIGEDGVIGAPVSWDKTTGCVCLDYPETVTHVYIRDGAGNELHLLLTPA